MDELREAQLASEQMEVITTMFRSREGIQKEAKGILHLITELQ
jgi:hypothetical protein